MRRLRCVPPMMRSLLIYRLRPLRRRFGLPGCRLLQIAASFRRPDDHGRQRVRIDGDRNARFEDIIHIVDLCQFEGLRNVGLHTQKNPGDR